jgi:hypothetical protein
VAAGVVDEIDVSVAPLILGAGARPFEGLDRSFVFLKGRRPAWENTDRRPGVRGAVEGVSAAALWGRCWVSRGVW